MHCPTLICKFNLVVLNSATVFAPQPRNSPAGSAWICAGSGRSDRLPRLWSSFVHYWRHSASRWRPSRTLTSLNCPPLSLQYCPYIYDCCCRRRRSSLFNCCSLYNDVRMIKQQLFCLLWTHYTLWIWVGEILGLWSKGLRRGLLDSRISIVSSS